MTQPAILILSGVRGDTRRYRSVHLAEQAVLAGMQVTLAHAWQNGLPSLVKRNYFDIAVFQRVEMDRFIHSLVSVLRARGTLILYDTDDLVFDQDAFKYIDSPDFSDPLRARLYIKAMNRQKEMLLASDAILVSTDYLVKQVRRLDKAVWVHTNAFSLEMLALSEAALEEKTSTPGRIVVGYASGTRTHDRDLAVALPAIRGIMEQYPRVELWLVGEVDPGVGWERFGQRVRRIPKVDWRDLPGYLAQFDINLAPLVAGNPFAESKSAIKYMEAALVKCPTVASACGEFRIAIRDGENGFLAFGEQDWKGKLTRLVEDAGLRREMGSRAYQEVMEKDHPLVRSEELREILNSLSMELHGSLLFEDSTSNQQKVNVVDQADTRGNWDKVPGDIQRGWVTLWRRGPVEVLGGVWLGIRRCLAPIFPFRQRKMNGD
jgi:glycosyltransferase involved in cell wall biosynthesis